MNRKIIIMMSIILCLTGCGNSDSVTGEETDISTADTVSEIVTDTENSESSGSAAEVSDNDVQLVEIVPPCKPSMGITLELPVGWSYEFAQTCDEPTSSSSVYIKPDDTSFEGQIVVEYIEGGVGVCGTGLKQMAVDFNGYKASQGFYDGNEIWAFIMLEDEYHGCVILNDQELYEEYSDTIDDILSTVRFRYYE